jgi:hypothetical protein
MEMYQVCNRLCNGPDAAGLEGRKFFFEKKNQKTFIYFRLHRARTSSLGVTRNSQKFFASFFQKRSSFFLPLTLTDAAISAATLAG